MTPSVPENPDIPKTSANLAMISREKEATDCIRRLRLSHPNQGSPETTAQSSKQATLMQMLSSSTQQFSSTYQTPKQSKENSLDKKGTWGTP